MRRGGVGHARARDCARRIVQCVCQCTDLHGGGRDESASEQARQPEQSGVSVAIDRRGAAGPLSSTIIGADQPTILSLRSQSFLRALALLSCFALAACDCSLWLLTADCRSSPVTVVGGAGGARWSASLVFGCCREAAAERGGSNFLATLFNLNASAHSRGQLVRRRSP